MPTTNVYLTQRWSPSMWYAMVQVAMAPLLLAITRELAPVCCSYQG